MDNASIGSRLMHAWNAFMNRDPTRVYHSHGNGYSSRPDRPRFTRGSERSITAAIFNRIALDVAAFDFVHCRLDDEDRFTDVIDSTLNNCLSLEANKDQTARAFIQDVVMTMFDKGCVALVPIDTSDMPNETGAFDIYTMRVGEIIEWFPDKVKVRVYNDATGEKEDVVVLKRATAIIENPFYAVVNEQNSTIQRLIKKINLLDVIDEQSGSGKLDLIIQLPYVIKTEARRQQAENRKKDIEAQLSNSKFGIAYTDSTERITQLNRPVENNLLKQIEYLTNLAFSQLNMTQSILDGTADEKTMNNYFNRSIEPIVSAIVDEMKRKFLTKTARRQKQSIKSFRDPFKLIPASEMAEIADKMIRNEVMTKNEIRQKMGLRPSTDPGADKLSNPNISQPNQTPKPTDKPIEENKEGEIQNGESEV